MLPAGFLLEASGGPPFCARWIFMGAIHMIAKRIHSRKDAGFSDMVLVTGREVLPFNKASPWSISIARTCRPADPQMFCWCCPVMV
jgi:hypothetical protein